MSIPVLPQWATDDIQNDISGQYNVVEPPTEKKLAGWELGEKPNRQWWNWLARQTYLCLEDLQTRVGDITTDIDAPGIPFVPVFTGIDNITDNFGYYSRIGNKVYIQVHITFAGNTLTSPISFTVPFPSITQLGFFQTLDVSRIGLFTLPNGVKLYGLCFSGSSSVQLYGENFTTGAAGPVSGTPSPDNNGQLVISGFYYAEPL